jgi:D-altritol 5-dehydrogenase
MKAVVFPAKDEVVLSELPDPVPGRGEAVIEVCASGICHTDIEVLRGNYGTSAFPVVPGHEYSGLVLEVGEGVEAVRAGDRVVVDPNIECGTCAACRRGWAHLCENLEAYGVTRNGGFSERSVVSAAALHPIGELPFHVAAFAEPMGCVLNGLAAARAEAASSALVFGAGPMGLLMAVALRGRGVSQVAVVDIDEARLELVDSLGFAAIASGSAALAEMKRGVDLAVDATGLPKVAGGLTEYIANGGSGLFFGVCPADARIEVSPYEVFRRQLTLAGSHSLNHNISEALQVIETCQEDVARLVSHRLPFEKISQVFSGVGPKGSLKIQASRD